MTNPFPGIDFDPDGPNEQLAALMQRKREANPPMTAPPTTGADELRDTYTLTITREQLPLLNDCIYQGVENAEQGDDLMAMDGFRIAIHQQLHNQPVATVPDAELRALAEWRSQHKDDMWELLDYLEAGIDEETDVAQRVVMRERFDELRALLEGSHLAGDAARTEEGEHVTHPEGEHSGK